MKKIYGLTVLLLAAFCFQSKAQNLVYDANAEVRKVDNFTGVDVGGGIALYISQGNEEAVAVSAEDSKTVSKIKTEVRNGVLRIYVDAGIWNGWNWGNKKIKAYVTVTELQSLELSGGSVGKIADAINVNNLKINLSGGSIIEGQLKGANLDMDLSGGSIAKLSGSFSSASVDAGGGSIVKTYDASIDTFRVEASGGSVIAVTVNKELSAEASGGSVIDYKGNGVIKSIDTSGGSTIKKKDS